MPLTRFLLVILMIVKEASHLSLQRRCLLQIPDCTGAVEELALELRGDSIPAISTAAPQTLQNLLFFLNKGSTVVVILFRWVVLSIWTAIHSSFWQALCRSARDRGILSFPSANAVCW